MIVAKFKYTIKVNDFANNKIKCFDDKNGSFNGTNAAKYRVI